MPKIKGMAHNLCANSRRSGVFYFELDKEVDARWENLFSDYISAYKPAIFSLFSPAIVKRRYIRVHAEQEGVMGIENVLISLQAMVSYANSRYKRVDPQAKATESLSSQDEIRRLRSRLAGLNY
ncbi:hypothetical protein [Pantoea sp. C2G6]|uniref:hypothetical protein n=1 Tax=Pantoea sp. C2G6 TaxID=3243084 RepID=UPI003ED8708A